MDEYSVYAVLAGLNFHSARGHVGDCQVSELEGLFKYLLQLLLGNAAPALARGVPRQTLAHRKVWPVLMILAAYG